MTSLKQRLDTQEKATDGQGPRNGATGRDAASGDQAGIERILAI